MDRPVLFSAPMVRAILREIKAPGTGKTQTRRVLKLPTKGEYIRPDMGGWAPTTSGGEGVFRFGRDGSRLPCPEEVAIWNRTTGTTITMPYQVGDRLWVRETWAVGSIYDGMPPRDINPEGKPGWCGIRYAATDARLGIKDRSSIHMPRWASRITLHVTDVRVERLQDISEEDAIAEGIEWREGCWGTWDADGTMRCGGSGDPREAFRCLWININGSDAWASNPWVAAISFRPVLANIDAGGK